MKMKSVYCYMLAGLMLSASSCSSWLSEDDAPVMSYDYYETEAGVNAAITAAYGFLRWGVGGERFDVLTELGTDLFTEGEDGSNRESYNKYATQLNPDDGILYEMWENRHAEDSGFPRLVGECENTKLCRNAIYPRLFIF